MGFERDDEVIGRPVDVAEAADGAIYVSDDYAGAIYRVTRGPAPAAAAPGRLRRRARAPRADPLAALDPAERDAARRRRAIALAAPSLRRLPRGGRRGARGGRRAAARARRAPFDRFAQRAAGDADAADARLPPHATSNAASSPSTCSRRTAIDANPDAAEVASRRRPRAWRARGAGGRIRASRPATASGSR